MSVALTETAMIALDRRFDQARRIAGGSFKLVLPEADRDDWCRAAAEGRVSPKLSWNIASGGGVTHVPLNSGTNQRAQLVVVHSTQSS
jgi:hypothetical protein